MDLEKKRGAGEKGLVGWGVGGMVWVRPGAVCESTFFLGSRHDPFRFLGYLENPSSNHGEGNEEGGGARPGDEEGHAARDEGHEEVSS